MENQNTAAALGDAAGGKAEQIQNSPNIITDNRPNPYGLLLPNAANIPPAVKALHQWIVYRAVPKLDKDGKPIFKPDGSPKLDKIPIAPLTGAPGAQSRPEQWTDFDTAWKAYQEDSSLSGVGFCLGGNSVTAIDIDDCLTAEGELTGYAIEAMEQFGDSYVELSPSGRGIRVFVKAGVGFKDISKPVEIYQERAKRFVTVAGHRIGSGTDVIDKARDFAEWYGRLTATKDSTKKRGTAPAAPALAPAAPAAPTAPVALSRLPAYTLDLISGRRWETVDNDASTVLFNVCRDMVRAGFSDTGILSVCLDPSFSLVEIAERHTHSKDPERLQQWIMNHNLQKARAAVESEKQTTSGELGERGENPRTAGVEPDELMASHKAVIAEAYTRLSEDIAAISAPNVMESLLYIKKHDEQEFKRIFHRLKVYKIATDVRRELRVFFRKNINSL